MDRSELTSLMLEWEKQKKHVDELERIIKNEVMYLEESFTAGNVYARFAGGRRTFNYEEAAKAAPIELIEQCTKTTVTTDWKMVCDRAGIEEIPFTIGNPSVSLSIK